MQSFGEIDGGALSEWLEAGGDLRLIDVRTPTEAARGVIGGAANLPLHLVPVRSGELPRETPLVLYCQTGTRSAQACAFLAVRGLGNVYNLAGGIERWLTEGRPVADGAVRQA